MAVRRLKIAVVGTGGRAQTHLSTIPRLHDRYALCAVCDVDAARAAEVGARYGVSGYTDVIEMLERERPEVAVLVVPTDGHQILTARITAVAAYNRVKTPPSASRLVKRRPAGESGCTSMNPTVVMVMTVMYRQSRSDQPSATRDERSASPHGLAGSRDGTIESAVGAVAVA